MICLKFRDYNSTGAANDFPVYRYADALLYYAEAICRRDGKPDETAMEALNQVHRRAYGLKPTRPQGSDFRLADYATQDKFMELLLQERGYETAFEGKRYCDLKRCGKLAEYAVRAGRVAAESRVGPQPTGGPYPPTNSTTTHHSIRPRIKNPGY